MNTISSIKSHVSLRRVAGLCGIELPNDGIKLCSPFRHDESPSCSVKNDLFTDWSRGEHLDQIDFYATARQIEKAEAIRELARIFDIVGDIHIRRSLKTTRSSKYGFEEKKLKRASWPQFEKPSPLVISQIAILRGISIESVSIAAERGLLFSVTDRGEPAWAVTDASRLNARIRKLDGSFWYGKSKSMPPTGGGQDSSWPIGIREASSYKSLALVEGEADLLALLHLAWGAGIENHIAPVAMLGSGDKISAAALPLFTGKRIRIFQDHDKNLAGERATRKWGKQLLAAGADVDAFEFSGLVCANGESVKDLNDFVHVCPDQWESERATIDSALSFVNLTSVNTAGNILAQP